MTDSAAAPRADGMPAAPPGRSLGGRLIVFGTLITLVAVATSFLTLSLVLRRQTRVHLTEILVENQTSASRLQERTLEELLRVSTLVTASPTLRAALDTYRTELVAGDGPRRTDLLATVEAEVRRVRELVGKDVAIVTDETGTILAADPAVDRDVAGAGLKDRVWMSEVLGSVASEARPVFGVMTLGEEPLRVGCVPIALQGFVIGTLVLGDRMDAAWLEDMQASLRSDVALMIGGKTVRATTVAVPGDAVALAGLGEAAAGHEGPARLIPIGREEFLTVPISLGPDDAGAPATLLLMRSLTRALQPVQTSLLLALLTCGVASVALAGVVAWRVSRSIVNPLERFVAHVRSVATDREGARDFDARGLADEIGVLNEAFSELLASVRENERQMLERQKEELVRVERLKESEKLASLGRMLSGAAHEINNPLTAVLGQVDLALITESLDEGLRERLTGVRREAHRISALVKNLLKVAHRDRDERTIIDVNQVLEETVSLRRHDFAVAGIGLRLDAVAEPVLVEANELELQQVFLNIIGNAHDALKGLPGEPALAIRSAATEGRVTVTLADNGPGMKDPRKVFDHFYTTKEVGKGTGLGLSITHAIVLNHGGSITAHNLPEGGACFSVVLPLARGSAARARTVPARAVTAPAALGLRSALVVEDEPSVLEYQMEILRSVGAVPVGARSGDEAIERLSAGEFEVIVSDIRIPGSLSGMALFDWVRRNRPEMAGRFVFVTGDTASEATREFLERSGRPYLMKPFDPDDYLRALRDAGGEKRA